MAEIAVGIGRAARPEHNTEAAVGGLQHHDLLGLCRPGEQRDGGPVPRDAGIEVAHVQLEMRNSGEGQIAHPVVSFGRSHKTSPWQVNRLPVDNVSTAGRFVKPRVDIIAGVNAQRRRTRQPEIRPDQILDAAQCILLDGGVQAMTMDAVAEVAGLGKGTIYHHYRSKADLLSGLRARHLARMVAHADTTARQEPGGAALTRVDRFLETILQCTADNHELLWILFHQTAIEEEDELAGIYEALLALVCEGAQSGEMVIADPEFTTGFLLHGFHGMTETAFHSGNVDVGQLSRSVRSVTRSLLMR